MASTSKRKRVLIITYYWPPAGGITVLRCLKIAKYLREFGWEPIVLTAENAQYPYLDESNLKDIPEGIEVLKVPIWEPSGIFKRFSGRKKSDPLSNIVHVRDKKQGWMDKLGIWVRGNFFIPDARAFWIKPSVRFLEKYLAKNPVDAIFSDGPPHTNTVIACEVSKRTGIPWLADFQDPWTQVDYYALLKISARADRIHKEMEQEVFRVMKAMTIASPTWKKDIEAIGAHHVEVLYYGYDEDDFKDIKKQKSDVFTIFHAGLMGHDRYPENLVQALKKIKELFPEKAAKIKLDFYGQVDFLVSEEFKKAGIESMLTTGGTISRVEVLSKTCNAQLLLLPLNKAANAKGRMPGKFYEYLRAGRPILCLGPNDSDVAKIIHEKGCGRTLSYQDVDGTVEAVLELFDRWEKGDELEVKSDVAEFSNRSLTQKVATFLNQISS